MSNPRWASGISKFDNLSAKMNPDFFDEATDEDVAQDAGSDSVAQTAI